MGGRKFSYQQPKTAIKKLDIRRVETAVKRIKRPDKDTMEIFTQNGTRCTISSTDEEYRYSSQRWEILYKTLGEGDPITLVCFAGKILNVEVEMP